MRRINIRRIAIALVFGVVATVLVAWYRPIDTTVVWLNSKWRPVKLNPARERWPIPVPADWPQAPSRIERERDRWSESLHYSSYIHQGAILGPVRDLPKMYSVWVDYSGWPCRALERYMAFSIGTGNRGPIELGIVRSGWPLPNAMKTTRLGTTIPLPLMPLWPGFAINMVFYGSFAFAVMAGTSVVKRRRRFKRGLCGQCAYPTTGLNRCPECGTAVRGAAKLPEMPAESIGSTPV